MRTAKTLIRLGGCPGWSESSLGTHAILLVLSYGGSNGKQCRRWSDCSFRSRLIKIYTVCPDLSARKLRISMLNTSLTPHCTQPLIIILLLAWYDRNTDENDVKLPNEPPHDKTNKMTCAPSEDSDQPGHLPSLISLRCPHEESLGP